MKLSAVSPTADHFHSLRIWFRELDEDPDGCVSLQHEVMDAVLKLRFTREKDGWCNWDDSYHEFLDTLSRWLCGAGAPGRIARDIAAVKHAGDSGADDGDFADAEMDRLTTDVFLWCLARREAILLPAGSDFWSDVPADFNP